MGKVTFDITMSLDGYITGPNDSIEHPLGIGGERLHQWVYDLASWRERHGLTGGKANLDAAILEEAINNTGAVVMGRRMFDIGEGPWGDEPPFHVPVFVVTHQARATLVKGLTTFIFITEGIEHAIEQARAAAGTNDVAIAGGAQIIQQCLHAGLVDEFQVHIAHVLLGSGRRLFDQPGAGPIELESTRVVDSTNVTHLRFRVAR